MNRFMGLQYVILLGPYHELLFDNIYIYICIYIYIYIYIISTTLGAVALETLPGAKAIILRNVSKLDGTQQPQIAT